MWAKTFLPQLLVVPSVLEYSWVQESCVDQAHYFHICCMKLTFIASRPYRQAVLQVHFSLMLFSAYSFTLWRLFCKLIFLWLNSVLTTPFDWLIAARCLQCTPCQVLSRLWTPVSYPWQWAVIITVPILPSNYSMSEPTVRFFLLEYVVVFDNYFCNARWIWILICDDKGHHDRTSHNCRSDIWLGWYKRSSMAP